VLLRKRNGLTLDAFSNYWKDVHGPVCARLPGQHQYWQFHLSHNENGIWPEVDGIKYDSSEEEQFDGIAELTFLSDEDCQIWLGAAAILMADEHNIFSKTVGYLTSQGGSKTYLDRVEIGDPNGNLNLVKLHVMLRKVDATSIDDFRKYLVTHFAPVVAKSDLVFKFRLHLLEEHDNFEKLPPAPGVSHYEPLDKQYQAAFEIAFRNRLDMERFFASEEYAFAVKEQSKYVKQLSTFPERNSYTFVYDSKMTLAGQRGSTTAALIENIGATNQLQDNILNLMFGTSIQ
jgi:hypothetical protein